MDKTAETVSFDLEFSAADRTIEAKVPIPTAPMRTADLLPVLMSFSNAIVGIAEDVAREGGKKITCRAGCGACCRQAVPVSEPEALYIAEMVAALPPERQARVRARFQEAIAALGEETLAPMRDPARLKTLDSRRAAGNEYFRKGVPCPFLENESCSIHVERPLSCREYLVTSPAANCKNPGPGSIEPVPVPLKLSEVLYCFDQQATRWVPLVLALEWAEAHAAEAQKYTPGSQLFERFLKHLATVKGD